MRDTERKHSTAPSLVEMALVLITLALLVTLAADTISPFSPEASRALSWIDTTACAVFFADFCFRFSRAESKRAFMKWGWIDLVASIPYLSGLRYARLVRVLRVIRLLRGIRVLQRVFHRCLENRVQTGAISLTVTALLLVGFSSIAILICEQPGPGSIKTAEDAVWWSISTLTTVGYGDMVPVTSEGRVLAMMLMVAGVGMFGGLGGLAASIFLRGTVTGATDSQEILARLDALQAKIDAMERTEKRPPS